ncbi:MAG: MFS transporter, partial [Acidimicrobiales bacterium]
MAGDPQPPAHRARPGTDTHPDAWHVGTAGVSEAVSVPWPLLARRWMAGRARRGDRYRWWVLWTVLAGLFSVNVTFTIFAVALPRIAGELGTTENTLTWVITGPLLAFGVVAPVLGKAGDLWGHRRLYLFGMGGACVFAALSAAAPTAGSLIAIRTLSAVQGAATGASSMALIFSVFQRDDRVKAMGWWSLVGAGGPVFGVAIGGPAIEAFGWRWIFVAQVPLTLIALGLAAAILHETTPKGAGIKLDWQGGIAISLGVTSVLFGFNRGPEWGWAAPAVLAAFVAGPVAAAAFVFIERRAQSPLLPLAYLRRRNFSLPIAAQLFSNFAYMGGFILAPSLLSQVYGYGESK